MRDGGWSNGDSPPPGHHRTWLKWVLGGAGLAIAIPLLIGGTIGSMALRNRARIWPAVRTIHTRLQTDEGARDLFLKNPALADTYADSQTFVETARDWRDKIGALPVQQPSEGPSYQLRYEPDEAGAAIQGLGGAWMSVDIQGGTLAGPIRGEGLTHLLFGVDEKGLEAAREAANTFRTQHEWNDFRNLMLQCGDDRLAAKLYAKEPGLQATYRSQSAFLEHLRTLRLGLAGLPVERRDGAHDFSIQTIQSPLGHTRKLAYQRPDGQLLVAIWGDGQLTRVELRLAANPG